MHPYDIDSWAKNGNDAQLESVLGILAELSEQDPKKLAEEVRNMSGSVRKHMHDYPGTTLLEAWEAQADGRFKDRSEATAEAMYTVRGINRGTGSLESRFHRGKQLNNKKHMSEETMEARLRIHIDGPPLEKFCTRKVVKGRAEYAGSALCKRSQAQYRMNYGSKSLKKRAKSKAEDEASIPQRSDKGKRRTVIPGRMAEYLKLKAAQANKKKKNAISSMDELVMKKLQESTQSPSDAQLQGKEKAKNNLEKKRKFIAEMLKPQSKVLKEKNDAEVAKHKQEAAKRKFHVASLHHNALEERRLLAEECKMFGAQKEDWAEDACKSLSVFSSMQKFLRRSPDKKKLWFTQHTRLLNDPNWKQGLVDQKVLSEDMALLGAVVFGGYLVDEKWVKKSTEAGMLEKELLVEPVWKLVGSMQKALELTLDQTLVIDGAVAKECMVLVEAKPDRILVQEVRDLDDPARILQEPLSSHWIWRRERSEIRRKESWVVCGDQARVEKLTKKKENMDEEVKKLVEKIAEMKQECESAVGAALLQKQRQLKEKQGKLKEKCAALAKTKGVPITLPKFLEEVVLPQCHLVPQY